MTSAHLEVPSGEEKKSRRPSPPTVHWLVFWSNVSDRPRLSCEVWFLAHAAIACISSLGKGTSHPVRQKAQYTFKKEKTWWHSLV